MFVSIHKYSTYFHLEMKTSTKTKTYKRNYFVWSNLVLFDVQGQFNGEKIESNMIEENVLRNKNYQLTF